MEFSNIVVNNISILILRILNVTNKLENEVNLIIKPLKMECFESLHTCWNLAFNDYIVNIQIIREQLQSNFLQNGLCFEASVGAFDNDKMVGFLLNGVRKHSNILTAYDTGTAIVKKYRGKGLAKQMFCKSKELLNKMNVKKYLLEVITTNETAYNLYLKSGFAVTRTFDCFEAKKSDLTNLYSSILIKESSFDEFKTLSSAMLEYTPCWSYTIEALSFVKTNLNFCISVDGNEVVGFISYSPTSGRISQVYATGISKDAIYSSLLKQVAINNSSEKIIMLNVPQNNKTIRNALLANGFKQTLSQFEMEKLF